MVFVLLFSVLVLTSTAVVLAQDFGLKATAEKAQYGDTDNVYSTISLIIRVGLSFVGVIFLAIMFYAGLRWMTGRGNEEFATKAKEAMFNATMGLILVSLAYALTVFVFSRLIK